MPKLLFWGDSPTVHTGFGIVSKNLLKGFQEKGYDIAVIGVNHFGLPYDPKEFPYPIFPVDKEDQYGTKRFWYFEDQIKPDIIFMLNDPWLIKEAMDRKPSNWPREGITKFIAYYPTDGGPLQEDWLKTLDTFDAQVCYTKYAESVVTESNKGKRPKNLYQIYHGVDTNTFKPLNMQLARQQLHIPTDAFIVGMVARNQYRKRFDIVCQAFAEFAEDKPNAKLYLHTSPKDVGFDLPELVRQFKLDGKLIITKDITPAKGVTDQQLNVIYNTFDVNVLISLGDGFGLPVIESMAAGCPQIVSGHSALLELVEGHGGLTVKNLGQIMNVGGISTWGIISDYKDLVKQLNTMYASEELRIKFSEEAYNYAIQDQFKWPVVVDKFDRIMKEKLHILNLAA